MLCRSDSVCKPRAKKRLIVESDEEGELLSLNTGESSNNSASTRRNVHGWSQFICLIYFCSICVPIQFVARFQNSTRCCIYVPILEDEKQTYASI